MRLLFISMLLISLPAFAAPESFEFKCERQPEGDSTNASVVKLEIDRDTKSCLANADNSFTLRQDAISSFIFELELSCDLKILEKDLESPLYQVTLQVKAATPKFGGHQESDERVNSFYLILNSKDKIAAGFGRNLRGIPLQFVCR